MNWRPVADPAVAGRRAALEESIRRFFCDRQVLEVSTPTLSKTTVTQPEIESFSVENGAQPLFLQTSPEYFMKRLLAAGYPDIFQMCQVYRRDESGPLHQPEFSMLEWYRRDFGLSDIVDETVELVETLLENRISTTTSQLSYQDAFSRALSVDPLTADSELLASLATADRSLQQSIGDDREAWLDLLMADRVAPEFAKDGLTVVLHYPLSQAALARQCPADDRVADRFEVFFGNVELANGYVELTDASEQRARFEKDRQARHARGQVTHEIDGLLIDAMRAGLPECAGVAMGIDRLLMIQCNKDSINSVRTFGIDSADDN